jgi:hypothetical protein
MNKDDNVVHSEERGYYSSTLTHGTTLSSPPIKIENTLGWKNEKLIQLKHNFDTELNNIQKQYDELVQSWMINERVYSAKCSFIPVVGNIYHLYLNRHNEEFLSIISPNEWDMEWIGSYELNIDGKWKEIKVKN